MTSFQSSLTDNLAEGLQKSKCKDKSRRKCMTSKNNIQVCGLQQNS